MAVTNAENGNAHRQDRRINARRAGFCHASRATRDDDAADAVEVSGVGIDRQDVTLNADLAHAPREQVAILAARIENRNSLHGGIIVDSRWSTVGGHGRDPAY